MYQNEWRSESAVKSNLCIAPCCPLDSQVPYKSKEQINSTVHSLCCSSPSQRQSCRIQKRGESVPPDASISGPGAPMSSYWLKFHFSRLTAQGKLETILYLYCDERRAGPRPSGFPSGFAFGKSLGAALPALGKPPSSLLFYLD